MKEVSIVIDGSELLLSSDKTAYDPVENILYLADLHAGKAATLRMHGIPISEEMLSDDLNKLTILLQYYQPKEMIVLGDFFHARAGRLPEVFRLLHQFRKLHLPVSFSVIIGNHDKSSGSLPDTLQIQFEPEETRRGSFSLRHFPTELPVEKILCGHLHPAVRLPSIGALPCFVRQGSQLILPSFGSTTGCSVVERDEGSEFFVVSEGEVFVLP